MILKRKMENMERRFDFAVQQLARETVLFTTYKVMGIEDGRVAWS